MRRQSEWRAVAFAAALALLTSAAPAQDTIWSDTVPPPVARELRGLWVATVDNMDWPSRSGLSTAEQQRELLAILDRAAALHMNAIIFQVRPEADALYESALEPWSRYLTGIQGRAPDPFWDPLAFAIREAHRRGMELHAWFNPYRAAYKRRAPVSRSHVSVRHPGWIVPYADYLWMNPGIPAVRKRMVDVIVDVLRRYDVDGVHIDDYFYPYPESRCCGRTLRFADGVAYRAYRRDGGTLSRDDWRRHNVDLLVRQFYAAVKERKPWVKVGISPFGIWRPGNPRGIESGVDSYSELFADSRKWLREGTLDYVAPQLYWPVRPPDQSYPVLLQWWVDQNVKRRHVWPGLALYKLPLVGARAMHADDIVEEIGYTRMQPGASGHIHFSATQLLQNVDGIADRLAGLYDEPALVPASPWLDSVPPARPHVRIVRDAAGALTTVQLAPGDAQRVRWWVVQRHSAAGWRTAILSGDESAFALVGDDAHADIVSAISVDAVGNESSAVIQRVTR